MEATATAAPQWQLRLGRHLVGLAAGTLAASLFMRFGLPWDATDWLVSFVVTCGIAGIITGLAALFFTKSQVQHSLKNFIIAVWVVLGLMVFGHFQGVKIAKPVAAARPAVQGQHPKLDLTEFQKPAPAAAIDWDKGVRTPPATVESQFVPGRGWGPNDKPAPNVFDQFDAKAPTTQQSTMRNVDAHRVEITEPDGRMTCLDMTKARTILLDGTVQPAQPGAERPGPCQ